MAAPAAAAGAQLLLSVGLIEKDANGDTLWVWCYPSITGELRELLLRKCCLREGKQSPHNFLYGQYKRTWFYITAMQVDEVSALEKVTNFCVVLTAKDFNPEKYAAFSQILCRIYLKQGSPVPMMESYISVLTKGACRSEENGTFLCRNYDQRKSFLSGSIKDVVSQFGMETIILYTAVMLKKRIVVYHPRLEALQEFTRTLPAFAWHRQDWSTVHPYVHINQEEIEALRGCPEALTLGKLHKDIGQLIVQSAENAETSDSQVIKDICVKTGEIISTLTSFAEATSDRAKPTINLEHVKQKRFPPATENFLFHLAAAEQMLQT
ncbi:hypothetical protein FKM82_014668 [Ascaphus truei]